MKNLKHILAITIAALTMSACGSNNNGQGIVGYNANGTPIYGTPGTTPITGVAGCIPVQSASAIPFSATGAAISTTEIMAGLLPQNSLSPGQHGAVTLSSAAYPMTTTAGLTQLTGQFMQGGSIQLNAAPGGTLTGTIQLNQQSIAQLMAYSYGTTYTPTTTGAAGQCISSIAIDAIYTSNSSYSYTPVAMPGMINQAIVYVTLSTGQVVTLGFR